MTPELTQCHERAWDQLDHAVRDRSSPFRLLTLSSVQLNGTLATADARLLVLRQSSREHRQLIFHTDIRSPKWQQLTDRPHATVLGYDPNVQLQLRLQGQITLHASDTDENLHAWRSLPPWTQNTYCGPTPGTPLDNPESGTATLDESSVDTGRVNFGLIDFNAASLDYCQLQRANNTRAFFNYRRAVVSAQWIAP